MAQTRIGTGFDIGIRELDGQWHWKVTRFGRVMREGMKASKKEATESAWQYMRTIVETNQVNQTAKSTARLKLRSMLERRPYLVLGTCELLLSGIGVQQMLQSIAETERHWWKQDVPEYRVPLPKHHRALTPVEAARQLVAVFQVMGYLNEENAPTKRLERFAKETFPRTFEAEKYEIEDSSEEYEEVADE